MKISKSKQELARIISENGGWREGAESAAQCKSDNAVSFYRDIPDRDGDCWWGEHLDGCDIGQDRLIANWHQSCLSRAEYLHLYPAPDAKPEFCESVMRSIPEPEAKPTIEQLLQDWRNADDYAKRKQAEADGSAAMRDERWQAVQARAGEFNVTVGRCDGMVDESELVITDWRNLLVGDIVEIVGSENERWLRFKGVELFVSRTGAAECGLVFSSHDGDECGHGGNTNWRFIRRP